VVDLPLESIHSAAFRGAEIVRCSGDQGKYWEMRDRLFANPQTLTQAASHAAAVGIDAKQLDACLASGKYTEGIRSDMAMAQSAGIGGTPSFILATDDPATGKLKPLRLITGAQPFGNFKALIDAALEGGGR